MRRLPLHIWLGGAALATMGVAALATYRLLWAPLPKTKGRLRIGGLQARVEVIRDRWGIPHIYAPSEADLFFAQGFVHAQERLWQMDLLRRVASGRLAEVVGEEALASDRLLRRVGLHRAAQQEARQLDAATATLVEAYCAGVNAGIGAMSGRLPLEFRLLRYRPEPWRAEDVALLGRLMAWAQAGNWDTEIARSRVRERLGAEATAALTAPYQEGMPLTVPPESAASMPRKGLLAQIREVVRGFGGMGGASNAWAVAGARSTTGRPLLASDPHMPPQSPSLWYENHLQGGAYHVSGASIPGLPGVAIGHNERIAWGLTASTVDQQDLFEEQLNPEAPHQYRSRGRWQDGTPVREEIRARGQAEPHVEEVLVTEHGPVISPCIPGEERILALKSVVLEEGSLIRAGLAVAKAKSWQEFRAALALWPAPSVNFVYADMEGNIGYQLAGRIPIRKRGAGDLPAPGWDESYGWRGYIPFDQLPYAFNPPSHFVVSANHKIVGDDYRYHLSSDWFEGYRAQRIEELLRERERVSVDDFKAIQQDAMSLPAREFVQVLAELQPDEPALREAVDRLRGWDGRLTPESAPAAIYGAFVYQLCRNVFRPKLGEELLDTFMGARVHPMGAPTGLAHRLASHLLTIVRQRPADWLPSQDGQRPAWDDVLRRSLEEAVAELRQRLGPKMSRWRWGRLHRVHFAHPLGRGPLARLFNLGPFPLAGDQTTVAQAAYLPDQPFDAAAAVPVYRQVIDLSDFNNSVSVITTGQSGHPLSRHYRDQLPLWLRGDYHPMPFEREAVLAHAQALLILEPDGAA